MTDKPWTANGPEDRLSIAVDRFLRRTLVPPFYCTAIHDRDGGQRSMLQRTRDRNRGIQNGQLDWDVIQGLPYLHTKLELKRGKNKLTEAQIATCSTLLDCGSLVPVCYELADVYCELVRRGFRFQDNVVTVLHHLQCELAAWDRQADLIKSGAVVKKRSTRRAEPKPTAAKLRAVAAVRARVQF